MGSAEKFCLRWNDFENNISAAFRELREDKDFFDVTLACEDDQIQAHKVIISACSPFFKTILRRNRHEHPLLYLKGVRYVDLVSVMNFMYHGEVNVAQEDLNSFLSVAEDLKVKGLTQTNSNEVVGEKSKMRSELSAISPPKHQRPSQPQPKVTGPKYSEPDDDIQEVLPVKSEPVSMPPEPTHIAGEKQGYSEEQQLDMVGPEGEMVEYGGDYYGNYDQGEDGYDDMGVGGATHDGNKDLSILILEKMVRQVDRDNQVVWHCLDCGKNWSKKSKCQRHVETHIVGASVECMLCQKMFKNRPCLDAHMLQQHKGERSIDIYGKFHNFSTGPFFSCN